MLIRVTCATLAAANPGENAQLALHIGRELARLAAAVAFQIMCPVSLQAQESHAPRVCGESR